MRRLIPAMVLWCLLAGCEGRPRSDSPPGEGEPSGRPDEPHLAEIDLRRGAPELAEAALFGDASGRSFADLVLELRELGSHEEIKGLFVRLGTASMSLARAEEVGRLLGKVHKEGLPIVCHADGYDNASMMLAARGCGEIWVSPAGTVETVGLAAQLVFMRSMLEELKVEVDFLQKGRFKGAEEPFTRNEPSPEARSSLERALRGMRGAWIEAIREGRGKSAKELALEEGPHTPVAANKLGLIDEIGFEADAQRRALERAGVEQRVGYFGNREKEESGIADLVRLLSGTRSLEVPHVVVLPLSGAIALTAGSPLTGGGGIEERELTRILRRLEHDDSTKAVVLRIDSPGGSALASDLLWRGIMDLRAKKPVVASIGAMAASGGYYLACAANKVVAEASSIVGSIGVVGGKLSFAESLEAIGVHVEAVPANADAGSRALYGSPLSPWDEATRNKVNASIEHMYHLFLDRVAEGRGLERSKIEPAAEGRIMGGADAKEDHLVDEIGGLDRAIAIALELAALDSKTPVQVMRAPSGLLSLLGLDSPEARIATGVALEREAARRLAEAILPMSRELRGFTGSIMPLTQGEHVLAALPFALAVR